jgi:hypothetical protein
MGGDPPMSAGLHVSRLHLSLAGLAVAVYLVASLRLSGGKTVPEGMTV